MPPVAHITVEQVITSLAAVFAFVPVTLCPSYLPQNRNRPRPSTYDR